MKPTDPHSSHRHCMVLFERLSEYIDRELDAPTCSQIEAHIKQCRPCQVCLGTLRQTVDVCRHLEHRQVPEMFSLKLKGMISDLVNRRSD